MSYAEAVARVTQIERERAVIRRTFEHTATASVSFADELAQAQGSVSAQPVAQAASSAPIVQGTLTSGQQQFASTLAADTGLDPQVIGAWLLSEESEEAAVSRQAANNNDWLNIRYTDSGTYGSTDSIWSSPAATRICRRSTSSSPSNGASPAGPAGGASVGSRVPPRGAHEEGHTSGLTPAGSRHESTRSGSLPRRTVKRVYSPILPGWETRISRVTPKRRERSSLRNSTGATPDRFDTATRFTDLTGQPRPLHLTVIRAPAGNC